MSVPKVEDVMPVPLSVCPANAKIWVLLEDFYYNDGETRIAIPRGFETDFASIPRFLWQLLPQWGLYGWAALIHDYLYSAQYMPRWRADRILLRAMAISRVPHWQRYIIYAAVWFFGCWAWMMNRRKRRHKVRAIAPAYDLELREDREHHEHRERTTRLRKKVEAKKTALRMVGATLGYSLLLVMFLGGLVFVYGIIFVWCPYLAHCILLLPVGFIAATLVCFVVERRLSSKLRGKRPTLMRPPVVKG